MAEQEHAKEKPADSIIIPALPGFQLLSFHMDNSTTDTIELDANGVPRCGTYTDDRDPETYDIAPDIHRETIIGWRIEPDWYPTPITADLTIRDMENWGTGLDEHGVIRAILDPAGAVIEQDSVTCEDLDGWIKRVREQWRQWKAGKRRRFDPGKPPPAAPPRKKPWLAFKR